MTIEHNADQIAADLAKAAAATTLGAHVVTIKFGALLKTRVVANASGRPGPRVQTGDYRRSWHVETSARSAAHSSSTVYTNKPQARRLEHGYVGTDSLGRHAASPPFPHAGPALDATGPEYLEALSAIVGWAL